MDWKKRIAALSLAGGALTALPGCPFMPFACNANPDPCCSAPDSADCKQWNDCRDAGGSIDYVQQSTSDGGTDYAPECVTPDAGNPDGG
jgi:hypothetical protein